MSITCNCSPYVEECSEFTSVKYFRARKPHKCCECGETIYPGQEYEHAASKYQGEFATFKTCTPCYSIRDRYCPDGYIYGELRLQIKECLKMDYVTGECEQL